MDAPHGGSLRPFRFGVVLDAGSRGEWRDKARRAEDMGFDVISYPDHLGAKAPFPLLITLAEATERVRVGTMVLDAAFYRPALLARDIATVDLLTEQRLELGLGAGPGWAKPEFEAAGLPFPSGGKRVDHVRDTIIELRRLFAGEHVPPVKRDIPVLVAGSGDRLLRVAAEHADIVSVAGVRVPDDIESDEIGLTALGSRISFAQKAAGDRDLEYHLILHAVEIPGHTADPAMMRRFYPHLSEDQLWYLPNALRGSATSVAETLHRYREEHSITYITVLEPNMAALAEVIPHLR